MLEILNKTQIISFYQELSCSLNYEFLELLGDCYTGSLLDIEVW